jgi:23S rRNA maturation mini-RNase III
MEETMKKKKVEEALERLNELFDRAERQRKVKIKHIKEILERLEKRESEILKKLENGNGKTKQLNGELDMIQAQRKKGKDLLVELLEKKEQEKE